MIRTILLFTIIFIFQVQQIINGKTMEKTIMIDLDGVLDNYDGNFDKNNIPEIKPGAKEFIIKLSSNYELILFTTRSSKQATLWLQENKIDKYFKDVTNVKIPAYIYIDDRALKFIGRINPHNVKFSDKTFI